MHASASVVNSKYQYKIQCNNSLSLTNQTADMNINNMTNMFFNPIAKLPTGCKLKNNGNDSFEVIFPTSMKNE